MMRFMSDVLHLLLEGEHLTPAQIGEVLGKSASEIEAEFERLREEKILLGWRPILNPDRAGGDLVRAIIEVKVSPEREGGFDRIAERISKFDDVESCRLMSGDHDLQLVVRGDNLLNVARFVSEKLATIEGVLSTATHFLLRSYKESGYMIGSEFVGADKPPVSP